MYKLVGTVGLDRVVELLGDRREPGEQHQRHQGGVVPHLDQHDGGDRDERGREPVDVHVNQAERASEAGDAREEQGEAKADEQLKH